MKVKIVQRKNPQKPDEPGKFYGQPVLDGVVGMDMICRQIAGRSSLTAGDVKNVLTNFLDELPTYMPSAKMKERVKSEITFEVINRPAPSSSSDTPGESD